MLDPRTLLSEEAFSGVVATVRQNNPGMVSEIAQRITTEALAFVAACAEFPELRLKPSRVVDEGWHALILHTRLYAELCTKLGVFVHHRPEAPDVTRHDPNALKRTMRAISTAGYPVDHALWAGPADTSIPVAADCEHSPPGPEGSCTGDCSNTGPNVA
ncbi:glycine-rich domain-containing protein [Kitasatospora acidiphila]|nr:hypothetical protein [Kitasatospora acidiphila]